ncbi:MAG: hypothetical protein ACTSWG_10240 [Candidatus Helarchaeota archaeon]
MTIIRKKIKDQTCIACNGNGIIHKKSFVNGKYNQKWKVCKTCGGTGKFIEYHNYIIDDKQKICFDADTGK